MRTKKTATRAHKKPEKPKAAKKKSPIAGLTNKERHSRNCKVCKHTELADIERMYLDGYSTYAVADNFTGISQKSVFHHVRALKLNDKRDNSSLTQCRMIIDRANFTGHKPSDALAGKAIELQAKIKGELIERRRHEGKVEVEIDLSKQVDNRVNNLLGKIGVKVEDEEEEKTEQETDS